GNDLLSTMKPNSIFLGGGDPVVYSVQYLRTIEGVRPDVSVIVLPLVSAEWYLREVRREYADVVVPDSGYPPAPVRRFIDANFRSRTVEALGDLPDQSTKGIYYFVSRGLIYDIRPVTETIAIEDFAAENKKVLATYHPSRYDELPGPYRVWERLTLVDY